MARPKRVASMGVHSAELTSEEGSLVRRRMLRERISVSPLKPQQRSPAKRGRPPKLISEAKTQAKPLKLNGSTDPDKTSKLARQLTDNRKKSGGVSETDIASATTPAHLNALINSLVSTEQDVLFTEFREKAAEQQAKDADVIADLSQKLEQKLRTIDALALQVLELRILLETAEENADNEGNSSYTLLRGSCKDMYESPLRRNLSKPLVHQTKVDDEFRTIAFTFDMLELLTGVRIISYNVDQDKFLFDVKQTSTVAERENDVVSIEYQLVIQREFEQKAEVMYIPVFLKALGKRARDAEQEAKNKDAAQVRPHLPEYLQQNLNFPYNTLLQFHTKLSKALNKSAKG